MFASTLSESNPVALAIASCPPRSGRFTDRRLERPGDRPTGASIYIGPTAADVDNHRLTHLPTLDRSDVATFVGVLRSHQVRLLSGLDAETLADELAVASAPARPVLLFDLSVGGDAATIVEGAIARLARLVADLWPFLWGGEDFSGARDDALTRAHLPLRAAELARRGPGPVGGRGRSPR